jgi:NADH-quinone oxidoreductase subunit E
MKRTIEEILGQYMELNSENLIPVLQDIQHEYGYLNPDHIKELSKQIKMPASKIYSIATFYNQFRFAPKGKFHIQVCRGTACHLAQSKPLLEALKEELQIEPGYTTKDGMFSLEAVACVGACSLAPVVMINERYHGKLGNNDIKKLIVEYRSKSF